MLPLSILTFVKLGVPRWLSLLLPKLSWCFIFLGGCGLWLSVYIYLWGLWLILPDSEDSTNPESLQILLKLWLNEGIWVLALLVCPRFTTSAKELSLVFALRKILLLPVLSLVPNLSFKVRFWIKFLFVCLFSFIECVWGGEKS